MKTNAKIEECRKFVEALKTIYPVANETLDNIAAIIEKEVPKGPVFREYSERTHCPNCKHPVSRYAKGHGDHEVACCKWCGQHIDWSVLDEMKKDEEIHAVEDPYTESYDDVNNDEDDGEELDAETAEAIEKLVRNVIPEGILNHPKASVRVVVHHSKKN